MAGINQIGDSQPERPRSRRPRVKQDEWLTTAIDDYLTGVMKAPRPGVFHPSSLGNPCDRALWLNYHGKMVDQPLPPTLQRIFQNRNFLEDRVDKWFTGLRILMGREISVKYENPPISGRIDFLIRHDEHGIIPVELKSINTSGFGKLTRPKEEHFIQLQLYLQLGKYECGIVLYENKNDQQIKAFLVVRDDAVWESLLERCLRIQNMNTMPLICTGAPWCACKLVTDEN